MNLILVSKIKAAVFLFFAFFLMTETEIAAQKTVEQTKSKIVETEKTKENSASKLKTKAASFELEDQFNKKFAVKFPAKKVTVLVFGDRKGAEQIEGWVRPLYGKFTDKIEIYGIAELSVVPWIAKGFVRNTIKSKSKNSIMLDWTGKVSKNYGYEKDQANLFVISRTGEIIAEKRGAATTAELENLYQSISGDLK